MSEGQHLFQASATWSEETKEGRLRSGSAALDCVHTGAVELGGKGGATNPEELLMAAVSACFVQTWAIFIGKLKLPIEKPVVDAECAVEKDPAGGFWISKITVKPQVPAALWGERRADVEKSLSLAEKYCIVSKAVRAPGRAFEVVPQVA
jgi:organic hydroperoxide reductase OsmC/OhrA